MSISGFIQEAAEKSRLSAFHRAMYIIGWAAACLLLFTAGFVIGQTLCYIAYFIYFAVT